MDPGERSPSEKRLNSTLMDSVCKIPGWEHDGCLRSSGLEVSEPEKARSLRGLRLFLPNMSDLEKLLKPKTLLVP